MQNEKQKLYAEYLPLRIIAAETYATVVGITDGKPNTVTDIIAFVMCWNQPYFVDTGTDAADLVTKPGYLLHGLLNSSIGNMVHPDLELRLLETMRKNIDPVTTLHRMNGQSRGEA